MNQKAPWASPGLDSGRATIRGRTYQQRPGRDQRAAADDHHVRIREVAHEMPGVARTREPVCRPRQVLQHHVNAAEQQEGAAGEEVLRQAPVVRLQLVIAVRLRPHRSFASREHGGDRPDHHREESRIRIELQRREALGEHGLPKTRFEEVDRQRPDEVDHDQDRKHDPGAPNRTRAVPYVLTDVSVADERSRRSRLVVLTLRHQNTFSITRLRAGPSPEPMSASNRSKV